MPPHSRSSSNLLIDALLRSPHPHSLPRHHPPFGIRFASSASSSSAAANSPPKRKYTFEELKRDVDRDEIDTVVVGFTDLYGRLLGKRYEGRAFVDHVGEKGSSHVCTYLLTADAELEPLSGFKLSSPRTGYGDFQLRPDFASLRKAAWQPKTAMVLCDVHFDGGIHGEGLVPMAPRSVLKNVLTRYCGGNKTDARKVTPKAASELEYYMFSESYRAIADKGYRNMRRAGFYNEDYVLIQGSRVEPYHREVRRALNASGMKVECTKGETGVAQHELNIEFDEVMAMADNHVVQKQAMKEIADARGEAVTFMAKPFVDSAGSSCHIHLSLHDASTGTNLFLGDETLGNVKGVSKIFRHFLGGWMVHTPEVFAAYAPTVNSYKRLVKGSWAPTTATWGSDNRTTSFRVLGEGKKGLRIECRLPGADANPYLAFAAAVASGMDGIEREIEPPPPTREDAYQVDGLVPLPQTLLEASHRMRNSQLALEAFGEDTREHLAHFYETEHLSYMRQVTDWERARYFERI